MDRELRTILLSTLRLGAAVLLQSTVLRRVALKGVKPDLAIIVLVFVAIRRGSMSAQVSGFLAGLEDVLSLAPLDFNALLRTVLGFFYGLTAGSPPEPVGCRQLFAMADWPFYERLVVKNGATAYAASGLPAGLVLNPATGLITGQPSEAGTFAVTFFATNTMGFCAFLPPLYSITMNTGGRTLP